MVDKLQADGTVSLFIDADLAQIQASVKVKAQFIELHTGQYAEADTVSRKQELVLAKGVRRRSQRACESTLVMASLTGMFTQLLSSRHGRTQHWPYHYQSCRFSRSRASSPRDETSDARRVLSFAFARYRLTTDH